MKKAIDYLRARKTEAQTNADSFETDFREKSVYRKDAEAYDIAIRALEEAPDDEEDTSTLSKMLGILAEDLQAHGFERKEAIRICGYVLGSAVRGQMS